MSDKISTVDSAEDALGRLTIGKMLDVATGTGGFISFLLENIPDYQHITGIDKSISSLQRARKAHPQDNIHFLLMDAACMDFPDSHFDTVCFSESMHHVEKLDTVLSEIMRVCKPGGTIILCEVFQDGQSETQLTNVYFHHWKAAVDTAEGIYHRETYTRQQVVDIIDGLGLYNLQYYELVDLESNPKDTAMIRQLEEITDHYLHQIEELGLGVELRLRGEEIKQRIKEVGFRGATCLLAIGKK